MVSCQPARACLQSVSAVSHVVQSSSIFLYALQPHVQCPWAQEGLMPP